MPQLDANGLRIEYDTFGDRNDEPILLIMGLGSQMIAWPVDFCNALVEHGHYVIRFDNRDVGLSEKFDGMQAPSQFRYALNHLLNVPLSVPYTLEDMAADAAGVLEALDIEAAHVVGASLGGMIAQLVTVNHPHKVKTLTSIMSSTGNPKLPKARADVWRHVISGRPSNGDAVAMIDHVAKSMQLISSPGYPRSNEEFQKLAKISLNRSFYPQGFVRQFAAAYADGSRVSRLKAINTPTLVIHGRDDPLVPVEGGIDTAKHIKGAKLEIIDGMGHDLPPDLIGKLTTLISNHALPKH